MLTIDHNDCWQARYGPVVMGCVLETTVLMAHAFKAWRSVRQMHGTTILDDLSFYGPSQEADGLVTDDDQTILLIKSADCVPVHVTDGHRIALLHAGWRGTADGIIERLAEYFTPSDMSVTLGPSIGAENYEVDEDLYGNWSRREPELAGFLQEREPGSSKRLFDLSGLIRWKLQKMGVPEESITTVPIDTYGSKLPSYRRDGLRAHRIFNYIYKKD